MIEYILVSFIFAIYISNLFILYYLRKLSLQIETTVDQAEKAAPTTIKTTDAPKRFRARTYEERKQSND